MDSKNSCFILFFALYAFCFKGYSQDCHNLLYKADSLASEKLYNESIRVYKIALRCDNWQNRDDWFTGIWGIDNAFSKSKIERNSNFRLVHLDAAHFFDSLILETEDKIQPHHKRNWIWVHFKAGYHFKQSYNYAKALFYYKKALLLESQGCEKSGALIPCNKKVYVWDYAIKPMNKILKEIGDHTTILQFLERELLDSLKTYEGPDAQKYLADFFIQKGISHYLKGEVEQSELAYINAQELTEIHDSVKAIILQDLGLLKKDGDLLKKAENLLKNSSSNPILLSDNYLFNGYLALDKRNFNLAVDYAHKGISTLEAGYKNVPDTEFNHLYFLCAEAYDSLDNPDIAEKYYHKTLESLSPGFRNFPIGTLPSDYSIISDKNFVDALLGLAGIWTSIGKDKGNISYSLKAIKAYQLAFLTEDQLTINSLAESTRKQNAASKNRISSLAIPLIYDTWIESKQDSLLDLAFFFIEKSRARELYSYLDKQRLFKSHPKLEATIQELNFTRSSLKEWKRRLALYEKAEPNEYNTLSEYAELIEEKESDLLELNLRLDNLAKEKKYHGYLQSKKQDFVNLRSLQKKLSPNTGFLYYAEGASAFFALGVVKDSEYFFKIPKDSTTLDKIRFAKAFNRDSSPSFLKRLRFQRESFYLYKNLIAPFTENISSIIKGLVISVPTTRLYDFPFESLVTSAIPDEIPLDYSKLDYLWERFEPSRAYSAALYLFDSQPQNSSQISYTGFAPLAEEINIDSIGYPSLIHHTKEVRQSDSIIAVYKKSHQAFLNVHATEKAFMESAENSEILHLAMHSFQFEQERNIPFLQFSSVEENLIDQEYDNRLYLYELYPLNLNSKLVIISACNSGQGSFIVGEGINHFGRGFRIAGAANTLISLWQLNDKAPSEIVPNFLRYLQEGKPKTEALNLARKDFFEDDNKDNTQLAPYFWANLVLEVDAYPLYEKPIFEFSRWYWSLGVLLGLILLAVFYFSSRKQKRPMGS